MEVEEDKYRDVKMESVSQEPEAGALQFGGAAAGYKPDEPMIVYDIERRDGAVRVSKPYLLRPDGSVAALTASLK